MIRFVDRLPVGLAPAVYPSNVCLQMRVIQYLTLRWKLNFGPKLIFEYQMSGLLRRLQAPAALTAGRHR